mmetsp:Transcript_29748/g.81500  ORF Transcript_29748/g.81500 Transcript_29748/m.81500 type:complete len:288 (-) Transcript_29748:605-1468(-)
MTILISICLTRPASKSGWPCRTLLTMAPSSGFSKWLRMRQERRHHRGHSLVRSLPVRAATSSTTFARVAMDRQCQRSRSPWIACRCLRQLPAPQPPRRKSPVPTPISPRRTWSLTTSQGAPPRASRPSRRPPARRHPGPSSADGAVTRRQRLRRCRRRLYLAKGKFGHLHLPQTRHLPVAGDLDGERLGAASLRHRSSLQRQRRRRCSRRRGRRCGRQRKRLRPRWRTLGWRGHQRPCHTHCLCHQLALRQQRQRQPPHPLRNHERLFQCRRRPQHRRRLWHRGHHD